MKPNLNILRYVAVNNKYFKYDKKFKSNQKRFIIGSW